jgi:superfamily II DNA or RNA helicase
VVLEGSIPAIKAAAARGALTWNGKKVVLDPFLSLGFFFEIASTGEGNFSLTPCVVCGSRVESVEKYELLSPLGALQGGTFRFWEDPDHFQNMPAQVSAIELEALLKKGLSHRFKGEPPRLKPAPLPVLKLTDRTGGFANLYLDYGAWGETGLHDHLPTPEEKHWESDLLETGFKKKIVDESHYFCPLDQVGKSLAFLLEMGWKVMDCRGKRVIRQGAVTCQVEEAPNAMVVRGTVRFGEKELSIQEVVGSFERCERWMDLSPSEVGLIELPPAWEALAEEPRLPEGIHVRKSHIGLLEEVVSLPTSYQKTEWEEAAAGPTFKGNLFAYQQKGLSWLSFLYRSGFSGLLADEMGLGKTIQVLALLSLHSGPVLIVMPVTLISLWKQQLKQFLPGVDFYIHQGPDRLSSLEGQTLILTSYATLRADIDLFKERVFDMVILDEAQMIKNSSTQITQSACQLKARFRLALTGTPIENRVEELHSLFHFLMPGLLETPHLNEMSRKKLRPFILRRSKQEVGLDLPEKVIQVVGIDPSEEEYALYETVLRTKRTELMQKIADEGLAVHRMEVLELILRLRQLSCHPCLIDASYTGPARKFTQVLTDLEEVVATQHKVLVYSQFTSILQLFQTQFKERGWNYVYLDGSTRDRETPVVQFQNDPNISIFLISLKAGGVGLNLQAADYVFLYDPWWNSAVEKQAIDRAHRVGRKDTVIARKYFTTQTIEAKILDLQAKKEALAGELWEDGSEAVLLFESVMELLKD